MKRRIILAAGAVGLLLVAGLGGALLATPAASAPVPAAQEAGEEAVPEDFIPSEQVPADTAVSFPVDI